MSSKGQGPCSGIKKCFDMIRQVHLTGCTRHGACVRSFHSSTQGEAARVRTLRLSRLQVEDVFFGWLNGEALYVHKNVQ